MPTLPQTIGFDTSFVVTGRPSKTWIIDRQTMQVSGMDDGIEAVRQTVECIMQVERYKWQIYSTQYGNELSTLVGDDYDYIQSELPRMVEEALMQDDRVLSVDDFTFERKEDTVTVTCTVHCVYGDIPEVVQI